MLVWFFKEVVMLVKARPYILVLVPITWISQCLVKSLPWNSTITWVHLGWRLCECACVWVCVCLHSQCWVHALLLQSPCTLSGGLTLLSCPHSGRIVSGPETWLYWWNTSSNSCRLTGRWKRDLFWRLCHTFRRSLVSVVFTVWHFGHLWHMKLCGKNRLLKLVLYIIASGLQAGK